MTNGLSSHASSVVAARTPLTTTTSIRPPSKSNSRTDSATPIGYVAFAVATPGDDLVSAATSYTVAERRTNVFPLVYDLESGTLHTHPVPRLKGRGIYRRQSEDADRLFDV